MTPGPGQQPDLGGVAVEALQAAVDTGDVDPVYQDHRALYGIARPMAWAGEVEALLGKLPHQHRTALRRAAKAIAKTHRAERAEPRGAPPPLPLLVEHGPVWWVLDGETYTPCSRQIVAVELQRIHRVDCQVETADGEGRRWMSPTELYAAHGVAARQIHWQMGGTVPAWDVHSRTLTIPCCRLTTGSEEYSTRIDQWLRHLAGEDYERLLDWLATYTRLDRPTAALYLEGPHSAGKGMLVEALSQLYGGERSSYDEVLIAGWTDGLRRSPLVHLDERASKDPMQRGSAALRSLVGESSRELRAKYQAASTIHGCPRVVITSNHGDALRLGKEELDARDEQAIGRRILHVRIGDGAAGMLRTIGGRAETEGWCGADGELVAHLRWLIETREVRGGDRLVVEGDAGKWARGHAHREGLPQQVLVAVARAAEGADRDLEGEYPIAYDRETAFVRAELLHQHWCALTTERDRPTLAAVGKALRRLATRVQRGPRGAARWVYPIDLAAVLQVADDLGLDTEGIIRRLGR